MAKRSKIKRAKKARHTRRFVVIKKGKIPDKYGPYNKRMYGKTNIARDRERTAKPVGYRIAKSGRRYWEARANRSDKNKKMRL